MSKFNKEERLKSISKETQVNNFDGSWLYSPAGRITKAIYRPVPKSMIKAYLQKNSKNQHNDFENS